MTKTVEEQIAEARDDLAFQRGGAVKTWNVEYAINGVALLQVEAETEEEARAKADSEDDSFVISVEWEYDQIRSVSPQS